jgi:hypothetical protein
MKAITATAASEATRAPKLTRLPWINRAIRGEKVPVKVATS